MLVGAILVVGPLDSTASPQILAGRLIPCLEGLGQSPLHRTIGRLLRAGVQPIAVVGGGAVSPLVPQLAARFVEARPKHGLPDSWAAAERTFLEYINNGVGTVLLMRLGAYVEFNLAEFLQSHHEQGGWVTRGCSRQGPLDLWCIDGFRARHATSLRELLHAREAPVAEACPLRGYVNRLESAQDYRRLVIDGFLSRCAFRPGGCETRPGVWVDESARIHRRTRVVAPAYIGAKTQVHAASLITRFSNLERNCHVDYGTLVEDASILPDTYLGAGLDVSHAVVCGNYLADLRRDLAVEIGDGKLIAGTSPANGAARPRVLYPRLGRRLNEKARDAVRSVVRGRP